MVGEVITSTSDWSEAAFAGYATERAERMRRLRICAELETDLRCTFTSAGRARRLRLLRLLPNDPMLAAATVVAGIAGPEVAPPEAFTTENIDRIRALT